MRVSKKSCACEAIAAAKAKRGNLEIFFPKTESWLLVFVGYFIDTLGEDECVASVVISYMAARAVIAQPYEELLPPLQPPRGLESLPVSRKQKFYKQFPGVARVLFPSEFAEEVIAEFERRNAAIDALTARSRQWVKTNA